MVREKERYGNRVAALDAILMNTMENQVLGFRAVRKGGKVIVGVFVASEQRWFECEASVGEVATIAEIFAEACKDSIAQREVMLTIEEIRGRIRQIRDAIGDPEHAHVLEDELREAVLLEIANGADQAADMAVLALSTAAIKFDRWCA